MRALHPWWIVFPVNLPICKKCCIYFPYFRGRLENWCPKYLIPRLLRPCSLPLSTREQIAPAVLSHLFFQCSYFLNRSWCQVLYAGDLFVFLGQSNSQIIFGRVVKVSGNSSIVEEIVLGSCKSSNLALVTFFINAVYRKRHQKAFCVRVGVHQFTHLLNVDCLPFYLLWYSSKTHNFQ